MVAAQLGNQDTFEALMYYKADVNIQNVLGKTALMYSLERVLPFDCYRADQHQHLNTFKTLLFHGADFNLPDNHGRTPLTIIERDFPKEIARTYSDAIKEAIEWRATSGKAAVKKESAAEHIDFNPDDIDFDPLGQLPQHDDA